MDSDSNGSDPWSARPKHRRPSSETRPRKRASKKSAAAKSPARNVTLHGETRKKRAKELAIAGEAVKIQSKKQGRLVSSKRNKAIKGGETSLDQNNNLEDVQDVLDRLVERKKLYKARGMPFDTAAKATLRVQLCRQFQETKLEFDEAWKEANEALNQGILQVAPTMNRNSEDPDGDIIMEHIKAQSSAEGPADAFGISPSKPQSEEKINGNSHADAFEPSQTNDSASNKKDPKAELLETIVKDILEALELQGQTEDQNHPSIIQRVLVDRKKYWQEQNDLPKKEWRAFFYGKVAERLEEASGWLQIVAQKQQSSHFQQEQNMPMDCDNVGPATLANHEVYQGAAAEEVTPEPPSMGNRKTRDNPSASVADKPTNHVPNKWSFLYYGPHYRQEGFQLDKWDTIEDIDQMSSDEEGR